MNRLSVICLSVLILVSSGCRAGSQAAGPVRPPAVAGQFYPADREQLDLAIARFLENAIASRGEKPIAIVVPHAGYIYCGQIMADAFRQTDGQTCDLVIILGTNHTTAGFSGVSVFPKGAFQTPLGDVSVDEEVAARILKADASFTTDARVHEKEHSIEVEVPWVQHLFPKARIVPIVVASPDLDQCSRLGAAIASAVKGRNALIVASSDLSHYPTYDDAPDVDRLTLEAAATLDPVRLQSTINASMQSGVRQLATCACGEAPILTAMYAAKALGASKSAVISYANWGDAVVGDLNRVVGYGAVVFSGGVAGADTSVLTSIPPDTNVQTADLTAADKRNLLILARNSIEWSLTSNTAPLPRGFSPAATRDAGCFVTLKKKGELRGCIGNMTGTQPLARTVGAMAIASAFEDNRFQPVEEKEMKDITVEISVLTPQRRIPVADSISVGRDGVVIRKSGKSAVFLPQVATEQGWTRNVMLSQLCRKAGLPEDAWKSGAEFFTFQAIVFSDADSGITR